IVVQFTPPEARGVFEGTVTRGYFENSCVLSGYRPAMKTDDLRIVKTRPLLSPAILAEEIPLSDIASTRVYEARRAIEAILDGKDARLLVVVGPCSVHDTRAALEYATKLKPIADALSDELFVVMRVYFEKPRTVVGWKGLINDPDLDESYHINKGLRLARQLLADVLEAGSLLGLSFSIRLLASSIRISLAGVRSELALRKAKYTESWRRVCRCRSASRTARTVTSRWPWTRYRPRAADTCSRLSPRKVRLLSWKPPATPTLISCSAVVVRPGPTSMLPPSKARFDCFARPLFPRSSWWTAATVTVRRMRPGRSTWRRRS